jgi:hypothetical protein
MTEALKTDWLEQAKREIAAELDIKPDPAEPALLYWDKNVPRHLNQYEVELYDALIAERARNLELREQCRQSFWVIERFENGRSAGYWDGASSRSFLLDIEKAIQFRRREDCFWATRGWHWTDVQFTEHLMMERTEP